MAARTQVKLAKVMPELVENLDEAEQRVARHYLITEQLTIRRGISVPTANSTAARGIWACWCSTGC